MGSKSSKQTKDSANEMHECDRVVDDKSYFNRRKGNTLDRSFRTLPRHLERGKNLSKRFRKSCRNWAASKGLLNAGNSGKQNVKNDFQEDVKSEEEDDGIEIEVIDLEEEPEVKLKAASEMDIGQLVADLVLDARRNNTLPRSKSRATVSRASEISTSNMSLTATSVADNDDSQENLLTANSSLSVFEEKSKDEDNVIEASNKADVLETCFDDDEIKSNSLEIASEIKTEPCSSTENSFYNGINLGTEFLVTASFSKELFKEETAGLSELDQSGFTDVTKVNMSANENTEHSEENNEVDKEDPRSETVTQEACVEITNEEPGVSEPGDQLESTVSVEADAEINMESELETIESNKETNENINGSENVDVAEEIEISTTDDDDDDNCSKIIGNEEGDFNQEKYQEIDEHQEEITNDGFVGLEPADETDESTSLIDCQKDTECSSIKDCSLIQMFNELGDIICKNEEGNELTSFKTNEEIENSDNLNDENLPEAHLNSATEDLLLVEGDSEEEFESIAKISALQFLNEDADDMDDMEDGRGMEGHGFNNYFSSSFLFNHPAFNKENSFPSLNTLEKGENSYLEAINMKVDSNNAENSWFKNPFNMSSVELRVNPYYKDEDSLNSNNSLITLDTKAAQPSQFNFNAQEFFDLWDMVSKEPDDEQNCSLAFNNLEAIIEEEEEEEEDYEVDENNNYDNEDNDEEEISISIIEGNKHETSVIDHGNVKHDNYSRENDENGVEICNTDFNIFNIETDIFDYSVGNKCKAHDTLMENMILEILQKIFESNKLIEDDVGSLGDEIDIDDEYFSCGSPDLQSENGSGISTDEGIEATDDDDEDEESHEETKPNILACFSAEQSESQHAA